MNGLATLPTVPDSALDGLPPAADLPTPAARRRYAQAITAALLGEPSWEITLWPGWQVPRLLALRAEQEDWPTLGHAGMAAMLQPKALPDDPAAEVARALPAVPAEIRDEVARVLAQLWAGELPEAPSVAVHVLLARTVMEAGFKAAKQAETAALEATPAKAGA